jgi:hypothetical protein
MTHRAAPEDMWVLLLPAFNASSMISALVQSVEQFVLHQAWNPRVRTIVVLSKSVEPRLLLRIFKIMWMKNMVSVIVLVPEGLTKDSFGVYTWFPFKSHDICADVQEYVLLDRWLMEGYGRFLHNSTLFPPKIPNDLLGCPFRASAYSNRPYVEISQVTEPQTNYSRQHYSGIEVTVLRAVAQAMNASLVFQDTAPRNDYMWGYRLQNGTFTGILGDVLCGRSDVALCAMPKGFDVLESILQSTVSYFDSALLWYVRCPGQRERWESLRTIFSAPLWATVTSVYVLMVLLTWKTAVYSHRRTSRESRLYLSIMEVFHTVFVVFVGAAGAEMPRTTTVRIIIAIWLWHCLAINLIFQTLYTSILVNPGVVRQVRNTDELLASELKLAYVRELDHLFRDGNDVREHKILRRRKHCVDVGRCLDEAAVEGDVVTIANNMDVSFRSNNSQLLCSLEDDIFRFSLAMFMSKGAPLLPRVDAIILRFLEAGLPQQWLKEHNSRLKRDSHDGGNNYFAFAMSHLSVAFVCLMSGHVLSVCALVCELLYHRHRRIRH